MQLIYHQYIQKQTVKQSLFSFSKTLLTKFFKFFAEEIYLSFIAMSNIYCGISEIDNIELKSFFVRLNLKIIINKSFSKNYFIKQSFIYKQHNGCYSFYSVLSSLFFY